MTYDLDTAKKTITNFLQIMGHSPYSLIMNKVDTESTLNYWIIEGNFQSGFMGQQMKFSCKYDPTNNSASKVEVEVDSESTTGYA